MDSIHFMRSLEIGLLELTDQPNIIQYAAKSGDKYRFDISFEACEKFGFYAGTRVITPKGPATVIGLYDNFVWFHIDGDRGASYWDNCHSYEDLLRLGVSYIQEHPIEVERTPQGTYKIKRIEYKSSQVNIVQQNENGPCPLIAIANILALRGLIKIDPPDNKITVDQIVNRITNFIKKEYPMDDEETKKRLDTVTKNMPDLQVGLDVNFNFVNIDSFEKTQKMEVFELLKIRMVHGWLVYPNSPVANVIKNLTYNDVTLHLATLEQEKMETKEESNKAEQKESEKKWSMEEGLLVNEYLTQTSHQLTDTGLQKLHENIKEDEFVVFFRNNHFSTLTKHGGMLFNLVTDIGYERERLVVWDLLQSVDGNSCFYSSDFKNTHDTVKEEVVNTALHFGFSREKIDEAIVAVHKSNEELKTDDVLAWLQKHASM